MTDECYNLIAELEQRLSVMHEQPHSDRSFVKEMRLIVEMAEMHAQQWMGHVHALPVLRLVKATLDNIDQQDRDLEEQYQQELRHQAEQAHA